MAKKDESPWVRLCRYLCDSKLLDAEVMPGTDRGSECWIVVHRPREKKDLQVRLKRQGNSVFIYPDGKDAYLCVIPSLLPEIVVKACQ